MATTGRLQSMVQDVKMNGEHFQSILQHYSAELLSISSATESIEKLLETKKSEICHLQDTLRGKNKDLAALKQQQKMTELKFIEEKSDLRAQFVKKQRDLEARLSVAQTEKENLKCELSAALAVLNDRDRTPGKCFQGVKKEDVPMDVPQTLQSAVVLVTPQVTQGSNMLPEFVVFDDLAGQRLLAVKSELKYSASHLLLNPEDGCLGQPITSSNTSLASEGIVVIKDPNNNVSSNDVTDTSIDALPSSVTGFSDASLPTLMKKPATESVPDNMPVLTQPVPLPASANNQTTQPSTQSQSISNMSEMAMPRRGNLRNVFQSLISELNDSTSEDFGFDPESSTDGGSQISITQPPTNKSKKEQQTLVKACSVVLERCAITPSCDAQSINRDRHSDRPVPVKSSEDQVRSHEHDDERIILDPIEIPCIDHFDGNMEDLVNSDVAESEPDSEPSWLPPPTLNPEPAAQPQVLQGPFKRAPFTHPPKKSSVGKSTPSAAVGSAAQAEMQKALQSDQSNEVGQIKEVTTRAVARQPGEFDGSYNNEIKQKDNPSKEVGDDVEKRFNHKFYNCQRCGKKFPRRDRFIKHMRTHTGWSEKAFAREHIETHTREKPYKCTNCTKTFPIKARLTDHIRIHTSKAFKCQHCQKAFSYKSKLVTHLRSHTGEKPFKCPHCPKAFQQKGNLMPHIRIHTGERPFKCPHCPKAFQEKNTLVQHIRTHTGEKPYTCRHCEKAFTRSRSLSYHLKSHTNIDC